MMLDNEIWLPLSLDKRESAPPEERWKFDLKWEKSGKGAIKVAGTINNIIAILTNDPLLKGKIRHNDFSTVIDAWNGVPIITSFNFDNGTEENVDL